MPSRGVQDYEEYKRQRAEERKKEREKLRKWCSLAGLTIIELVLCLICFLLAYGLKMTIGWHFNVKFLMFTTMLITIASIYLALTSVDLISWLSLRPITYFSWITVSTSGFIFFGVYAGVCLFYTHHIIAIMAIVFGILTSLTFLADLICCLLSLKRFPVPYWILKRKFEKFDECVCTGDYDPEEEKEIERPICRCGDTWGEPCVCDAEPDTTCGCGADQKEEPPCPCCSCSTQALVEEEDGTVVYGSIFDAVPRKSIVTTASGRDYIIEENIDPRKSTLTQVTLVAAPEPDVWCVNDPPARKRAAEERSRSMYEPRKSTRSTGPMGIQDVRKSAVSRKSYAVETDGCRASGISSRKSLSSRKDAKQELPTYSVYTTTVDHNVPRYTFESSSPPSPILRKSVMPGSGGPRKTIHFDDIRRSLNLSGDGPMIRTYDNASTDDEFGEGDFQRRSVASARYQETPVRKSLKMRDSMNRKDKMRFSTFTSTDYPPPSFYGSISDPERPERKSISPFRDSVRKSYLYDNTLPGQVPNLDEVSRKSRSVSVGGAVQNFFRRPSNYQRQSVSSRSFTSDSLRPRSDSSNSRTMIRNVSTTVRPIRTLSSVMETSHESRSVSRTDVAGRSDTFPSECTITINKR